MSWRYWFSHVLMSEWHHLDISILIKFLIGAFGLQYLHTFTSERLKSFLRNINSWFAPLSKKKYSWLPVSTIFVLNQNFEFLPCHISVASLFQTGLDFKQLWAVHFCVGKQIFFRVFHYLIPYSEVIVEVSILNCHLYFFIGSNILYIAVNYCQIYIYDFLVALWQAIEKHSWTTSHFSGWEMSKKLAGLAFDILMIIYATSLKSSLYC